jgi:hypothetical protein
MLPHRVKEQKLAAEMNANQQKSIFQTAIETIHMNSPPSAPTTDVVFTKAYHWKIPITRSHPTHVSIDTRTTTRTTTPTTTTTSAKSSYGVQDRSRNGIKWTESEIEQLIHEAHDMKSLQEIADIHKRAISSIRYKLLQYASKMLRADIHIDSIIKILPLKKKEIIEYVNKMKEEAIDDKPYCDDSGVVSAKLNNKYIPYERRNIILFDLNGTLCHRTHDNKKEIFIRPCVRHLAKLKNYYRLGIYTSVMRANALDILHMVEEKCGRIFDRSLIFTREHTYPFNAYEQQTFNIPSYKTKKSIAHVLPEIYNSDSMIDGEIEQGQGHGHKIQIKIVDDELVKIAEKDCAIIVPTWDGFTQDTYIQDLVDELTSSKYVSVA